MSEPAFSPKQQEILRYTLRTLRAEITSLQHVLANTERKVSSLTRLIASKGVDITPEEWSTVAREIEVLQRVDHLSDPLVQRGEELFDRLAKGEAVSKNEIGRWLHELHERRRQ